MHRSITLFTLLFALALHVSATIAGTPRNSVTITRVPLIDQLPSRCILTIYQDREGEMWYGTEDGLCRDNGHGVKIYYPVKVPGVSPDNNKITCVTADGLGHIWFGTTKGAFILDKSTQKITPVTEPDITSSEIVTLDSTSDGSVWLSTDGKLYRFTPDRKLSEEYPVMWNNAPTRVNDLYQDSRGRIFMTLSGGGICRLDQDKNLWNYYHWPFKESAMRITEDRSGKFFWVGTWLHGIIKFNPDAGDQNGMYAAMQSLKSDDERDFAMLHMVQDDHNGYIWATTMNGLKVFNPENGMLKPVDQMIPEPSRYQMLTEIIKDRSGNLWVGGYNVPSFIISFKPGIETLDLKAIQHESGHVATISQTCVDDDPDKLWVFQERHRLYLYDLNTKSLKSEVSSAFATTNNNVGSLYLMRKSRCGKGVWACCKNPNSIYRIYQANGKINVADHIDFSGKLSPRTIFEDNAGILWIGTEKNLYTYNSESRKLTTIATGIGKVVDIKSCDNNGVVVAACDDNGHSSVTWFKNGVKNGFRDFNLECSAVAITNDSTLWLGTRTGELYRAPNAQNPEPISSFSDYIPLGYIAGLFVDSNNRLWVQSEQRVTEITPSSLALKYYYVNDNRIGLFNFFPRSYAIHSSGKIIFGGTGGLCVISPTDKDYHNLDNDNFRQVYITELNVNGRSIDIPAKGKAVVLNPSDRDIEIEFSTNDHINAPHIAYAYRLSGQHSDERWQKLPPGTNRVTLNRLAKGNYTFEVKCVNGDNISTPDIVSHILINRKPSFYETFWFDLLLMMLLVVIIAAIVAGYNRSKAEQHRKKLEEELTQTKFRFFTNITHELRTPLTLIITPLDSMIRKCDEGQIKKQLVAIRKSAVELMNLINNILNFRRLEMGGEKLNLSKGDAVGFAKSIFEEFKPLAAERQIDFSFCNHCDSLYMDFDIIKLRIIVNNLLSNAFKFTQAGDSIVLDISKESSDGSEVAVIKVTDTGIGIDPSKQAHIFDRFYQAEENASSTAGSGIGLHLVEEYTKMHSGMIELKSVPGNGTTFTVRLPVINVAPAPEKEVAAEASDVADGRKKILIVEDNDEFREFMNTELSDLYTIIDAPDAFEGMRLATGEHPDIIISDVMMPGRDGYEFCRLIKNDVATSDIPVILLTARSDYSAELTAYENHADAFVQKPFNLQMLINRIENLISRRNQQHLEFRKEPESDFTKLDLTPIDRALLDKIKECVDRNLTNSDYSVAELSNDVNMSRMNLYRKLQNITGQTPSDFIKTIRLKKAAKMLLENNTTIVEVAYAVGYSSPSYFTRSFKSEFGVTPKQYLENNRSKI